MLPSVVISTKGKFDESTSPSITADELTSATLTMAGAKSPSTMNILPIMPFIAMVLAEKLLIAVVDVGDAVVQLGQLATVPSVGGSHQIARDALQAVNVL